jgi:hypothetical protein
MAYLAILEITLEVFVTTPVQSIGGKLEAVNEKYAARPWLACGACGTNGKGFGLQYDG